MFKSKTKKYGMKSFTNSLMESRNVLSNRVSDGMKYAQNHIVDITEYMRKNPGLNLVRNRIQKHPAGSFMALAGLGLIIFGFSRLARK